MQVVRTIRIQSHLVGHDVNFYCRDCHDHDCYEFILVISGRAVHHINDEIQILSPGTLLFVRPADAHYFMPYSENSERYEFYNIRVGCEELEREYAQCHALRERIESHHLPPNVKISRVQIASLQQKITRMKEMEFGSEREYLYGSILKDVCYLMLDSTDVDTERMPMWQQQLLRKIEPENLAELDYQHLLELSGVSASYLSKSFQKYLHMSPTEYINSLKLEYAYELITTTEYSMLDISMRSGFNSYSYFFRLFSQKYKINPNSITRYGMDNILHEKEKAREEKEK